MNRYKIISTPSFKKQLYKLVIKDRALKVRIETTLQKLTDNPFYSGLKSHIVDKNETYGKIWSSRVTGDVRILWTFSPKQELVLILLEIGGHDEVY
jgi:mRNA-degrading endonuclease YafQ of YafQ-DinJ toxin-antitoxin module